MREWIHRQENPLPAVQVGKKILVRRSQFDRWLEAHAVRPANTVDVSGLVNEVLPRPDLLPRALELAEQIMTRPRTARRFTHGIATRTWQRLLLADLRDSYAHQLLAATAGT